MLVMKQVILKNCKGTSNFEIEQILVFSIVHVVCSDTCNINPLSVYGTINVEKL